ncbi:LysR family transcriptional regulator [Paraburkholderia oxyphila]|uniref:LysR family transcriptional regulator n=1 Tax=Paraburkholderia oxyphila TaxID=614212 RepID=UPI000484D29A|nr:LysR substrate-binding domain-containing protein [Paraburkholderia oxyphila]
MKVHQLEALVAVADTGSIRAAARLAGLSQSAVSKTLRELETQQKLPLLVRNASGIVFTAAGDKLLSHARLVLGQLRRADEELAELRGDHVGRLSIAVTPWIMHTFVPQALMRFRERMPNVQLEIFEGLTAVTLPRLREGVIDCAVVPHTAAMPAQEFESEPLFAYDTCVIVRRGHPASHATSMAELRDYDWALNFTVATRPALMNDLFWQHGIDVEPRRLHCAHSAAFLLDLVRHAEMLGFCPRPMLATEAAGGWVHVLPLVERFQTSNVSIVSRRNSVPGAPAECFLDCLRGVIRQRARSAHPVDRDLFGMLDLLM